MSDEHSITTHAAKGATKGAASAPAATASTAAAQHTNTQQGVWHFLASRHWTFKAGLCLLLVIVTLVSFADWLAPFDPAKQSLLARLQGPGSEVTRPEHDGIAEVEDDDFNEEIEAVPLQLVFDNIHRMFKSEADDKGLSLRIADTSLCVQGSTIVLIRILSNLVSNAIKFTDSGSVLLGARRRSGTITLQVWDTGRGIEPAEIERIIQPYERADQEAKGYGLGLDIVHKLAAQHGLTVRVNSRVRAGSVISVGGLVRTKGKRK